jgi:putative ABC transport system ATP-binding protein
MPGGARRIIRKFYFQPGFQANFRKGNAMGSAVSLRDVVKTYRRGRESVEVLHHLSLEVPNGEFLALMGPSGSGKTTILNLVGGLDRANSGEVLVGGEDLQRLSGSQLAKWRSTHVGFVFQFYNLMPMLSAAANVELPLLLTNLSRAERKRHVAIALDVVGLSERASHKPGEMSGGQQQRVGIARAIVTDPAILLCDEPTGDLDRATADEILTLLTELNKRQGKTIVMVTHDPRAADYATRHVDVDKGQLIVRRAA